MSLHQKEEEFLLHTYKRLPIEVERTDGVYIYSKDGRRFLDFFGGLAVNALGYNHPRVRAAIVEQASRYMHMSNLFYMDIQIEFAETLSKLSGYPKVFLTNSGTEAVEAAMKLVRKWGKSHDKKTLFALSNSFHGRTFGALSLTDREKYRQGFEPFLPDVDHIAFNDVADLRRKAGPGTAAVFVEFIQGEGGVNVLTDEFVRELFSLKNKYGFLVVADEIQAGVYRTGKFFAFEHFGVRPDVVTSAKPIGGGLPLGAMLVDSHLADVMGYGSHGTTFGGNPVSCAAGLATLKELSERGLGQHVEKVGAYLKHELSALIKRESQLFSEVRGLGLMIGLECRFECATFVNQLLDAGVLTNCTNGNVIRLLPPLIIKEEHVDILMAKLGSLASEFNKSPAK